MRAHIIGRDGIMRRYKIPTGEKAFKVNKNGYVIDPKATVTAKVFGIPLRRFIMYYEGHPKPIMPYPNPGQSGMSSAELGAILGTKVFRDIGKQEHAPFPFRLLIYAGVGLAVFYSIATYLGIA